MKFLLALVTLLFVMRMSFAFTVPSFLAPVADVSEDSADGSGNCKSPTPTPCGTGCCAYACCDPKKVWCCF